MVLVVPVGGVIVFVVVPVAVLDVVSPLVVTPSEATDPAPLEVVFADAGMSLVVRLRRDWARSLPR
jgi:hypothetical protein